MQVGATVAGTVYGRSGAPVAGARVECGLVAARTNRFGSFRLSGVPVGEVEVRASHPEEGGGAVTVPLHSGDEVLTLQIRLGE